MKHSTWFRVAWVLLAAAGTIVPIELRTVAVNPADPQPDLVLAYNSERFSEAGERR